MTAADVSRVSHRETCGPGTEALLAPLAAQSTNWCDSFCGLPPDQLLNACPRDRKISAITESPAPHDHETRSGKRGVLPPGSSTHVRADRDTAVLHRMLGRSPV